MTMDCLSFTMKWLLMIVNTIVKLNYENIKSSAVDSQTNWKLERQYWKDGLSETSKIVK